MGALPIHHLHGHTGMDPATATAMGAALAVAVAVAPVTVTAAARTGMVTATVGLDEVASVFQSLGKSNDHCKVLITP